ncbi:hypothetical protein QYF36_011923 [Acer negundo]|nr:hypothetical protein QYF36_011923 [Acer negundo]
MKHERRASARFVECHEAEGARRVKEGVLSKGRGDREVVLLVEEYGCNLATGTSGREVDKPDLSLLAGGRWLGIRRWSRAACSGIN